MKKPLKWHRNPTAIPLMDDELGFHDKSPANTKKKSSTGWDGEQGSFLERIDNDISWYVNFTDLGRADYVQNALDGKFDMSKLRELTSRKLISRMECLKKCVKKIDGNLQIVGKTELWLISAEELENNSMTNFEGNGIPVNLIGRDKDWATRVLFKVNAEEHCYLFVFANTITDASQQFIKWAETGNQVKRRRQMCNTLYVCQVSDSNNSMASCP